MRSLFSGPYVLCTLFSYSLSFVDCCLLLCSPLSFPSNDEGFRLLSTHTAASLLLVCARSVCVCEGGSRPLLSQVFLAAFSLSLSSSSPSVRTKRWLGLECEEEKAPSVCTLHRMRERGMVAWLLSRLLWERERERSLDSENRIIK